MKLKSILIYATIIIAGFSSCKKDSTTNNTAAAPAKQYNLAGQVQKGPFILGSSISLYELDKNLNQTGRSYQTNISNDFGAFSFKNISLSSPYVLLIANGYYFNEVDGNVSPSGISLNAIVDASDTSNHFVNILTHLGKERLNYLFSTGSSYVNARQQSNTEVLKIFLADDANTKDPDKVNISASSDPDAALLAISTICQGFRTQGDLTDLLARISLDIKTDGKLDNTQCQSSLISDIKSIDTKTIRANVVTRYKNLGISITPGNFEKYINRFIDSSNYTSTIKIEYPTQGNIGKNLLAMTDSVIHPDTTSGGEYSFAATIPKGMKLKITCTLIGDTTTNYSFLTDWTGDWSITKPNNASTVFTATGSGATIDRGVMLGMHNNLRIDFYEGDINASRPTRSKTIRWTD